MAPRPLLPPVAPAPPPAVTRPRVELGFRDGSTLLLSPRSTSLRAFASLADALAGHG